MNSLPAGLIDHNYEFFTHEGVNAFCLTHSKVIPFEFWEDQLVNCIFLQIPEVKLALLKKIGLKTEKAIVEQFTICNYGGFDHKADMIDGALQDTEYWACPNRGKCAHEGKLCDALKSDTGHFLTHREIEYAKHTANGHLDKHIAVLMNISLNTVTTHSKNFRRKTGFFRKTDITRFAYQNNLCS